MTSAAPASPRVVLRRASLEEILDLRRATLRQGLPREAAVFDGDADTQSRHYGAFIDGQAAGCATLHESSWQGKEAWQLRGMATASHLRDRGIGRRLLAFLEAELCAGCAIRQLWCNARVPAAGFYEKLGWRIESDPFEIPTAGPHVRMFKDLTQITSRNSARDLV